VRGCAELTNHLPADLLADKMMQCQYHHDHAHHLRGGGIAPCQPYELGLGAMTDAQAFMQLFPRPLTLSQLGVVASLEERVMLRAKWERERAEVEERARAEAEYKARWVNAVSLLDDDDDDDDDDDGGGGGDPVVPSMTADLGHPTFPSKMRSVQFACYEPPIHSDHLERYRERMALCESISDSSDLEE